MGSSSKPAMAPSKNKVSPVLVCLFYLLSLSLHLQAGQVTCQNCGETYIDVDHSNCPKCGKPSSESLTQAQLQHSQDMAIQLFSLTAQTQTDSDFVISPDSLFQALSLVLMGATDSTQQQLQQFFGGAGHAPFHCGAQSGACAAGSGATPGQSEVYRVGNYLLLSNGLQLRDAYRRDFENVNGMIRDGIDFSNTPSLTRLAQELNQHICRLTQNLIPSFCDETNWDSNTVLSLINAVYFKGLWQDPFELKSDRPFTLASGVQVILNTVLYRALYQYDARYAEHNGWQAVVISYQGESQNIYPPPAGQHEMVLVLPPEGVMPHEVSSEIITYLLSSLEPNDVDLEVPPFQTHSEHELNSILSGAGLGCLFQSGSVSLGGMLTGSQTPVFFSQVSQSCQLKFDQKGTEAGAATSILMAKSIRYAVNVALNRPFLYLLRHKKTKKILFIGQLCHPENHQHQQPPQP